MGGLYAVGRGCPLLPRDEDARLGAGVGMGGFALGCGYLIDGGANQRLF